MPSVISKPTQRNTSVSFGKTDSGMPFFETQEKSEEPFTVEACDRILRKEGFRPMTPDEVQEFGKFLLD
jgi:hypothetical protein